MRFGAWFDRSKDPWIEHLRATYALEPAKRNGQGVLAGRFRDLCVCVEENQTFAEGIRIELGSCQGDPCFGFYRPSAADLEEALPFGKDGMARWENGESVRLGSFFLDYEGEARWRSFLAAHALAMIEDLGRYSSSLACVYLRCPGLEVTLRAPGTDPIAEPAFESIGKDLETSVRLLRRILAAMEREDPGLGASG